MEISEHLWKVNESLWSTYENLWKICEKSMEISEHLWKINEDLWKIYENLWKICENLWKNAQVYKTFQSIFENRRKYGNRKNSKINQNGTEHI